MRKWLVSLLLAAVAVAPAAAQTPITTAQRAVPAQLSEAERLVFTQAFRDVAAGRVASARAVADANPDALLTPALQAQIALAAKPGKADRKLADWLQTNSDAPQAVAIAARARAAGATDLPALPSVRALPVLGTPRLPKIVDPAAAALATELGPLLTGDRPAEAEALWRARRDGLAPASRAEWAQKIAWEYFQAGDDESAIRMGLEARDGGDTNSFAMGAWTAGLAAWRANDCIRAAAAFDSAAALGSSANYWASRAYTACGAADLATARLRSAATDPTGFYGLLARHALGIDDAASWAEPDFIQADWTTLARLPGARRAVALVEIGQLGLADRELKYLAATGDPANYPALLRLSARLNMPATQVWLAQRPPAGATAPMAARYPAPDWLPARGWRVDKALVFAHALQESNFVTDAQSRVGARGVMQLMPATARQLARAAGEICDEDTLTDPSFSIEYGQAYLEKLRDSQLTGGLLPKVIAAYNAGPGSVQKWNATLRDNGDPLLFIESIPFRETRHYVEIVLRNYWMYQRRMGAPAPSMDAIAAGLWPRFPGMPGALAVKVEPAVFAPVRIESAAVDTLDTGSASTATYAN